ncbi:MAG: DUF1214 domain-containing protein [Rhizobiales bacterium]|nr:DUF1214 domain-containing protein [Hyphomicrobiales bacterium]
MRLLIDIAIALVIAAVLGLATAWYAIDRGPLFGGIAMGPWQAWPSIGSPDADPYSIARLARTGEVPLGAGEGLAFTARTDQEGRPLEGRCTYRLEGTTPAARLWTLTAYDRADRLMANAARRTGFHSREILRRQDGGFLISVSGDVQPGNWLPIATDGPFSLVFRFYDTPLTTGGSGADSMMPRIEREGCR